MNNTINLKEQKYERYTEFNLEITSLSDLEKIRQIVLDAEKEIKKKGFTVIRKEVIDKIADFGKEVIFLCKKV